MHAEQSLDEKASAFGTKPPSLHGSTKSTLNVDTQKPVALPLCSSCASATPMMNHIFLNNEQIQNHLIAMKKIIDGTVLVCHNNLTQTTDDSTLNEASAMHECVQISGDAAYITSNETPDASQCILCAIKNALPGVVSLVVGMKSVWKEQTANMSKAEKKALKSEVKAQARDVKREFKMAKKLAKKERKVVE